MNEQPEQQVAEAEWLCANCNLPLKPKQITVSYLANSYPVDLLCCPQCGLVLVTEDLALGKMADVEKALEDK
jgi:hypothetical protein